MTGNTCSLLSATSASCWQANRKIIITGLIAKQEKKMCWHFLSFNSVCHCYRNRKRAAVLQLQATLQNPCTWWSFREHLKCYLQIDSVHACSMYIILKSAGMPTLPVLHQSPLRQHSTHELHDSLLYQPINTTYSYNNEIICCYKSIKICKVLDNNSPRP